jgi:folate-binding protein YgfZ
MTIHTPPEKLAQTRLEPYRGAQCVPTYTDSRSEFRALLSGCGVYDLAWRATLRLTGGDRTRWLNGMITNNVRDLEVGRGVYAFLLNPQGHILADLYAFNRGDSFSVLTDRSQLKSVLEIFDHYIIMDDVEVADVTGNSTSIGLTGPDAHKVLVRAGLQVPALEPLQSTELPWQQTAVTVTRTDQPAIDSYELQIAPERAESLRDALLQANALPVGCEALELLRVASGVPAFGQDIRERDLPQETEQMRALHFSKGCYVGQEIVERIRSRGAVHRHFTGFTIEGALPAPRTKVSLQGKDVGEITSAAVLPAAHGDICAALGYVRRESAVPGTQLEVGGARGLVTDLPFAAGFKN